MVTSAPTAPLVGEKLEIVGGLITVKSPVLMPVPAGFVTEIFPVVAAEGTVAVIWCVEELKEKRADEPLNATEVTESRFAPEMVISLPTKPLCGVKSVMVGRAIKPRTRSL